MYSYEDYFQAFRLYLTLGKRIKATVRQLGYPTCDSSTWSHVYRLGWHSTPRHLRQHEDCRRPDSSRQRARGQRDGELLPVLMTGSVTWPRTGEKGQVRLVRIPNLPIACARIVEPGDRRDRHDSTFRGFDQRRLARRRQSACDSDYFFPARDDFDRNAEVSTSPASIAMVTISNFFSRTASASRSVAERWVFTACSTRHSG